MYNEWSLDVLYKGTDDPALRSRFAPSHGSGSTPKTFPRNIFSAQDDSEGIKKH